MALNKIYICLPPKKEIDKLDWDGLSTEEYNGKSYYKISWDGDDIVKKITFETLKDNVTIKLNIINIMPYEEYETYPYASDLDSYSSYFSDAKYKVIENDQQKTFEYVVPTKGSHWIYIGYHSYGFDYYYGYFSIDYVEKNYAISQPKEVYLASGKINKITYGSIKILYPGFNNTISWETLTWDKSNNSYTYNSKGPLKMKYKNLGSSTSSSISLNTSPAEMPNNGQIDNINFDNGKSGGIQIMPYKIDLSDWDSGFVTNMNSMFNNCSALASLDVSKLNVSNVTGMDYMFNGCSALTSLDVSKWNVSNVTSMYSMFILCRALTSLDVSKWDTSKVTIMGSMFSNCRALTSLDVSKWNVDNVTNMDVMFSGCGALTSLDVSNWNVGNVNNMNYMFDGCDKLASLDVSNWNVGNVTSMNSMFGSCGALTSLDVSKWNVGNVTIMNSMFYGCDKLASLDVSKWNVGNVTSMNSMFRSCRALTSLDVSKWNVGNVTSMSYMFNYCMALTSLDVSKWNVGNVTSMNSMFRSCRALTSLDVSKWNVGNVTSMNYMFDDCGALTSLIDGHESEPDVVALNGLHKTIALNSSPKLNYESVYALFRGVATVTTSQTITLPKVMKGKLDTTKVKIATDKGWTVAYK